MSIGLKDFELVPKLIVGEGPSDCHFLHKLCAKNNVGPFQFVHPGLRSDDSTSGWEHFGGFLKTLPSLPRFEKVSDIALFCDSGEEPDRRFGALKMDVEAVSAAGPRGAVTFHLGVPNKIVAAGQPRLHVFMVPRVNGKGGLESLCLEAAAAAFDDKRRDIMHAVDEFSGKVCRLTDGTPWTTEKTDKLRLQAFISAVHPRKPDVHFYRSFDIGGDKFIPLDSDVFHEIRKFISDIATL